MLNAQNFYKILAIDNNSNNSNNHSLKVRKIEFHFKNSIINIFSKYFSIFI